MLKNENNVMRDSFATKWGFILAYWVCSWNVIFGDFPVLVSKWGGMTFLILILFL